MGKIYGDQFFDFLNYNDDDDVVIVNQMCVKFNSRVQQRFLVNIKIHGNNTCA